MFGEVPLEHDLRLGFGLSPGSSEFTDQSILERSPQSFDSALGLRGACRDQGYPKLLEASAYLGARPLVLELFLDGRFSYWAYGRALGQDYCNRLRQRLVQKV